jgi:signal transduction histidine kinase
MAWSTGSSKVPGRAFPRALAAVLWLRRHRSIVIALTVVGIVTSFVIDVMIPGYAIAGFYLFPLMLVAFALRGRLVIVVANVLCLALTIYVLVLQGRANGQNILLVCFGVLAGAGLIALAYLVDRFDRLWETERWTTSRLQLLTAQLQRLQEVSVLDADKPLSDLVDHIVGQARQLLVSDACVLFRLDARLERLSPQAVAGFSRDEPVDASLPLGHGLQGRAVLERRPVAVSDVASAKRNGRDSFQTGYRACLAVPIVARQELYGVIALYYRRPRPFTSEDVSLAKTFGDNAALAIENARLREQVERSAVAAERSRLARDLHDSVTQSLFAASLKAEALRRRQESASPEALEMIDDLQRLTRAALAEMRAMLLEMRSDALADSWLGDLLQHLVEAVAGRTRIPLELIVSGRLTLPPDVTTAFYRIVQEALNNVVRHSHARRSWVRLTCTEDGAEVVVGDDGLGFVADVGPENLGLRIMRERADAVGAVLDVQSESRHGTVVTALWSTHASEERKAG